MKQSRRTVMAIAAICIGVGIILALTAMIIIGFDFQKLNTIEPEKRTYDNLESFANIEAENAACDIILVPSADGKRKVVCDEATSIMNQVTVENGTLKITEKDCRRWYEHIAVIWFNKMSVTIYMPQGEYGSLNLKSVSGNIKIPEEFKFQNTEILSTSGDVSLDAGISGDIYAKSVSGNVKIKNASANNIKAVTTSGDVYFSNVSAAELDARSTSGNVKLESVTVTGATESSTVSGDIRLVEADSGSYNLKSVSGNIKGTIISPKTFITKTTSGSMRVPENVSGVGTFTAATTSGNIKIDLSYGNE